jgi:hypothetical protein
MNLGDAVWDCRKRVRRTRTHLCHPLHCPRCIFSFASFGDHKLLLGLRQLVQCIHRQAGVTIHLCSSLRHRHSPLRRLRPDYDERKLDHDRRAFPRSFTASHRSQLSYCFRRKTYPILETSSACSRRCSNRVRVLARSALPPSCSSTDSTSACCLPIAITQ